MMKKSTGVVLVVAASVAALVLIGRYAVSNQEGQLGPAARGQMAQLEDDNQQPLLPTEPARKMVTRIHNDGISHSSLAEQVFEEAKTCAMAHRSIRLIEPQLEACVRNSANADPAKDSAFLRSCEDRTNRLTPQLNSAREASKICGPVVSTEDVFFKATSDAAEAGSLDAQICYARGLFELSSPLGQEDRQEYESRARKYIESGFQRGDWRVVEILHRAQNGRPDSLQLPRTLLGAHAPSILQANRLLKLGAMKTSYASRLDTLPSGRGLEPTPQQLREAQQWADTTYQIYFKSSPVLKERPKLCENPLDGT
jgi:hypothetical protein